MADTNKLIKAFTNFKGLDLRSNDLVRQPEFASDVTNVEFREDGSMNKRKGYHARTNQKGGFGLYNYIYNDTATGAVVEELVTLDERLHTLVQETFTITYSGPDQARLDFYYSSDDGAFFIDLYDDNQLALHFNCGVNREEATSPSVADAKTAIDAVTNFSSAISGNSGTPAAFLDITRNAEMNPDAVLGFNTYETIAIPTNAPTPFSGHQAAKENFNFELASFANFQNCVYMSTGYDDLYKYDGRRLYKAGLPDTNAAPTLNLIAGAITDTNIKYIYTYEYTDNQGNFLESVASAESATISPSAQNVEVTVPNILDTTGFDTDSADLKINIYRTTASGGIFKLVTQLTNNPLLATQTYTDSTVPASLGFEYVPPTKDPSLPPRGRYITVIQNALIISGGITTPQTVYYSDILNPEGFPAGTNSFNVDTRVGDNVSGLAPQGNTLFVFKDQSIHAVSGDLAQDSFRVDLFDNSTVGCASHNSIQEVEGSLIFLSVKGVYSVTSRGEAVEELSGVIHDKFTSYDTPYKFKKAVAVNLPEKEKYVLHCPVDELFTGSVPFANEDSDTFVYDYYRQSWVIWNNINAVGGMTISAGNLYFTERRQSTQAGDVTFFMYRFQDTGDTWDYADHDEAISFTYKTHWESMGEPSMFKKFLRLKIHSLDASLKDFESDSFKLTMTTEIDYVDNVHSNGIMDFGSTVGGWGIDPWGTFPWGNARLNSVVIRLKAQKAKSLRLILENSAIHENVLISGYEYEIATPYKPFLKE